MILVSTKNIFGLPLNNNYHLFLNESNIIINIFSDHFVYWFSNQRKPESLPEWRPSVELLSKVSQGKPGHAYFKKFSYSQISLFASLYTLLCLLHRGILTRFKKIYSFLLPPLYKFCNYYFSFTNVFHPRLTTRFYCIAQITIFNIIW